MSKKIVFIFCISIVLLSFFFFKNIFNQKENIFIALSIDGVKVSTMPTTGYYQLSSYTCDNGSSLTWNKLNKRLEFTSVVSPQSERCYLNFTTSKLLLTEVDPGSYVFYVGTNGCPTTGISGDTNAQSENACFGHNANQDNDATGSFGYCMVYTKKFYVYGWRLAYKYDYNSNGVLEPYIISAGSPQCVLGVQGLSAGFTITLLNQEAIKYCNVNFTHTNNGSSCSAHSWAVNDTDFQRMTLQNLGSTRTLSACYGVYSSKACGYGNSLFENGGYYSFATTRTTSDLYNHNIVNISSFNSGSEYYYGLRPVLRLKETIYITSGNGTIFSPYVIAY